jgi:hypothetical protein
LFGADNEIGVGMSHNKYSTSGIFPERLSLAIRRQCQITPVGSYDLFGIGNVRYSESFKPGRMFHFGGSAGGW